MAPRSSTTSTASRRPSPLREATYPPASCPAGPSSSSGYNDRPSDLYHPHQASQSQSRTPRPKSIINLLLRASALDNATTTAPTPRNAPKHGKPTRASSTDDIDRDRASSAIKSLGRWDKRASRKAPSPPAARIAEESGAASAMASTAGPELSRQPGKQISSHGLEEENGDLWDREEDNEDMMGGQKGWEGIDSLPKVFLFPPEEDEIQPIKLYPPPPPPVIERPPLVNLKQSSSRPSSLFSIDSSMSATSGRNTWGGMEKQFGKPPPRFRRGGANVLAASGIVMPKKREQVVRERERRMSTYAPENMDWEAGAASYDPIVPRRSSSPPRLHEAAPLQEPTPTQPTQPDPTRAVQRSYSAPPAVTMSPPMIMITSDSMGSLTTETAHSAESFESDDVAQPAFASEAADISRTIVETPVSLSAPPLPTASVPVEEEMVISQSLPATVREPATGLELDLGPLIAQATPSHVNAPLEVISAQQMVPSASERTTLRGDKSRKRRSMSLTSVPSSRPAEVAPTMPAAPASGSKVIRKHKSLKKFFFSSDNLAKQEQEPMPVLDRSHVKDNEARRKEEKTKNEKAGKADNAESEGIAQARAKDDKKREMNKRSSLGGMLSRPKSKPSLRIDIKAAKHVTSAAPSPSDASETSTPTPAPLTGSSAATSSTSEGYPETPATSSSKTKGKTGTPVPESGGGTRGLTKRFSLSNMSSAFKRSKKDGVPVPQVPELPAAYKRDKAGRSMSADSATTPTTSAMRDIKHSAVPLSPKLQEAAIIDSPVSRSRPLLSPQNSPGSSMKGLPDPEPPSPGATSLRSVLSVSSDNSGHTLNAPGSPSHDDTSLLSDTFRPLSSRRS